MVDHERPIQLRIQLVLPFTAVNIGVDAVGWTRDGTRLWASRITEAKRQEFSWPREHVVEASWTEDLV